MKNRLFSAVRLLSSVLLRLLNLPDSTRFERDPTFRNETKGFEIGGGNLPSISHFSSRNAILIRDEGKFAPWLTTPMNIETIHFEKKKVGKKRRREKNPRCWGKNISFRMLSLSLSLSFLYALKIRCASTPLDCFKNERAPFFLSLQPVSFKNRS